MAEQTPVVQYAFLQHFYYGDTQIYESILCECINRSEKMREIGGGEFARITDQRHGQNDAETNKYSLDFKLMVSSSLAELQSVSSEKVYEPIKGVRMISGGKQTSQRVVLLLNACRNINREKLDDCKKMNDAASKEVVRFYEKTLKKPKNLFIFLPAYVSSVNQELPIPGQYNAIQKDLSDTLGYIFDYRQEHQPKYDTYFSYVVNIPSIKRFDIVITKFTTEGLLELDRVDMFSLKTVQRRAKYYDFI